MNIYFNRIITSLTLGFSLLITSATNAEESGPTYIDRELDYLMTIWPGDYDNQEQISLDGNADAGQELGQGRFHAVVTPVEIPSLGTHILYVELSMDGDLDKIYQRRIYALEADETQQAIRAKTYALKRSLHSDGLNKLKKNDLISLNDCDLVLRRDDKSFVGVNESSSCLAHDTPGILKRSIRITDSTFSFNDTIKNDNDIVSSTIQPRVMRKARWFACMIDVPKNTPGKSDHTQHYIKIHDQGGTFSFTHPDGREMTLLMRNTWSYGMQRETFFIGVLDGDVNGKTLVYSWGMPGADRIGMNPGYVRIQCDLDRPGILELQQGLRTDS